MAIVPDVAPPGRLPSVKARIKSLRAVYEEAQKRIEKELNLAVLTPFQKFRLGEHQKQIEAVISALNAELDGFAAGVIPEAYEAGLSLTQTALEKQGVKVAAGLNMGNKLHANAIQTVTDQMAMDLLEANGALADNATRLLRRVQATKLDESTVNTVLSRGLVEGDTLRETSARLRDEIKKGIAAGAKVEVHCKDGKTRHYDPAYYAELVAQTRTREATTHGNLNGGLEYGITLFQVSFHEGACDYCVQFQGKVYSVDGAEAGFPVLNERPPYHPWCEHVLVPFVPEAKTPEEVEAFREMSSDPALVLATRRDYTDALSKAKSGTAAKIGALVDTIQHPSDPAGFGPAVAALREAAKLLSDNADHLPAGTVSALEAKIAKVAGTLDTAFDNYTQKVWLAQAKADKIKYWPYANKANLKPFYTSPKPGAVDEAAEALAKKYDEIQAAQKAAKAAKATAAAELAAKQAAEAAEAAAKAAAEQLAAAVAKADEALSTLTTSKPGAGFYDALEKAYKTAGDLPAGDAFSQAVHKVDKALADWEAAIDAMTAKELMAAAKEAGLKYANYANKADLAKFLKAKTPDLAQAWQDEIADIAAEKMAKGAAAAKAKKAAAKAAANAADDAPGAVSTAQAVAADAYTSPAAKFADLDAKWASGTPPHTFTFLEKANNIGGAHPKEFYVDEQGRKWLFKPVHTQSSKWRGRDDLSFLAKTEEMGYKVQRVADPDAIEVRYIELDGRPGSIQLWRADDVAETFDRGIDVANFPEELIPQIQREHVVDWLISNHDGHAEQFLVNRDGHVWGIDKGQCFKYFPGDRLDINYNPTAYGSEKMLMNALLERAKRGQLNLDTKAVGDTIRAFEKLSDEEYIAILRPYAEGRFHTAGELQAFYDAAVSRKNRLRQDFEELYSGILGRPVSFAEEAKATAGVLTDEAREIIDHARRAAGQGKVLPFDGSDVEDQSLLMFTSWKGDKPRAVFNFKLRPEADRKFVAAFQRQSVRAGAQVGDRIDGDVFYNDILEGVKTINHHADDLQYNLDRIQRAANHRQTLLALLNEASDPEVKAMAQEYLDVIDRIQTIWGERSGQKIPNFIPYVRKTNETIAEGGEKAFSASRHEVKLLYHKRGTGRKLISENDDADYSALLSHTRGGDQVELAFDGGRIRYITQSDTNPFAHRGNVEIILDRELDEAAVEQAFEIMKRLDIDARVASPEDRELLYLLRQSYVTKDHTRDDFKRMIKRLDDEGASTEKRVAALRKYWADQMEVDDVTKIPEYNPAGEWELCGEDHTIRAGRWHQYRFDIKDKDIADLRLVHDTLYGTSQTAADVYSAAMPGNQTLTATIDKFRWNIPRGASPDSDMDSGGAAYVYTRLVKNPVEKLGAGKIVWKSRIVRRMDAVVYDYDAYGRTLDDNITKRRVDFIGREWWRVQHGETDFKYGINFIDQVERIGYGSEADKQRLIKAFKDAGYARLPDGRKCEDLFK